MVEEKKRFYFGCCGIIPTDTFVKLAMILQDENQDI